MTKNIQMQFDTPHNGWYIYKGIKATGCLSINTV